MLALPYTLLNFEVKGRPHVNLLRYILYEGHCGVESPTNIITRLVVEMGDLSRGPSHLGSIHPRLFETHLQYSGLCSVDKCVMAVIFMYCDILHICLIFFFCLRTKDTVS